jgi:Protein of unknown function (DUF3467)
MVQSQRDRLSMGQRSISKPPSRGPLKGVYANYFQVGHTAFEFVLDFGQNYAGRQRRCHTRIVTSPTYARALLMTLTAALEQYRRRFGKDD